MCKFKIKPVSHSSGLDETKTPPIVGGPMTENTKKPNTKSLRRYSAVSQVVQLIEEGLSLSHALNLCARHHCDGRHYSASTMEK